MGRTPVELPEFRDTDYGYEWYGQYVVDREQEAVAIEAELRPLMARLCSASLDEEHDEALAEDRERQADPANALPPPLK
jgi:hypothetical protein